jgi:hypothetical protein
MAMFHRVKVAERVIDKKLLFDGKSIRKGKDTVKEKKRVEGKGKEGVF